MNVRIQLEAGLSVVRQPDGFRTVYAKVRILRRFWVQRWRVAGMPNWTWGVAP